MARIFEPVALGPLALQNRLVRSATWEAMAEHDGTVTDRLVALYDALGAGGVGLIISSYLTVHPQGRQNPDQIGAHDDGHVPGLARLAQAVHDHGGKLVGQIVHCGGQSTRAASGGLDPLAPSAVESPGYPERPTELTVDQIGEIIASFAAAAGRIQQAGFDGVQLHGAHGYLISEFLSPSRNQRSDGYGGSLDHRCRFALEVVEAVRGVVGPDYPVLIKLNAHDFLPGSTTEEDSTYLAKRLVGAGIVAIEVSGGTPGSGKKLGAARPGILTAADEAYFLPQAKAIRAALPDTPLILVGGVRSLEVMETILADGVADAFAMSRPLIREPGLPARWQGGDLAPAACISCLGCFRPAMTGEGIRCMQAHPDPA
ncbi:MAG: NADH:flavin oxidoreductase [Deltaproteobacteria bacterium]|nr:NADH:flavin oxidoreductase [Deltaproteobacteria bacterium]